MTPAKKIVWEYINPGGKGDVASCVRGPKGTNDIHCAFRYALNFPGLAGKTLKPQVLLNSGCPEVVSMVTKYLD